MKYNRVFYHNADGDRREFLAKNLDDKGNIAALKKYEIWDDTESILLTPVDHTDHNEKRSFLRSFPNQPNKLITIDETQTHDIKV